MVTLLNETVEIGNELLAIIVRKNFNKPGVNFFTPSNLPMQLAFMNHSAGTIVSPHIHNTALRNIHSTAETLFIRKGRLKVNFYDDSRNLVCSKYLESGDVILLYGGGHGFEMLEDTEMYEVKQGPYLGDQDKVKF